MDISYAYVYLFSEWLTPGEVLFNSFRKLSPYFLQTNLITGYSLYERSPSQDSSIITDLKGSINNDFTGATGLQWDSTSQLNGGTAPGVNAANAELQMCDSGVVWSKGGNCFP